MSVWVPSNFNIFNIKNIYKYKYSKITFPNLPPAQGYASPSRKLVLLSIDHNYTVGGYMVIYICKWGLYGDTVLIPPVVFQGIVRQRHVGSRPHSSIEKSAFLCNARLKRWKQYARLRTQLAKRHIRNRDNSVYRLSAVRALNFHRKRSTCVLLTSVGCERS